MDTKDTITTVVDQARTDQIVIGTAAELEVFVVQAAADSEDTHDVVLDADGDFLCRDCGANGSPTGYLLDADGAQEWHDDTTGADDADGVS